MPFHAKPALRRAAALLAACAALSVLPAAPAGAGWREEIGRLNIGMVARPGAGRGIERLGEIETAYARAIGLPVEIFVARDYAALIEAHAAGRVHYAVYSAAAYAAAERLCGCVEPLAAPTGPDGTAGIRAVVLARKAEAGTLPQLRGRTVAAGPAGRLGAGALALAALDEGTAIRHAESADAAERLFAAGEVDALVGWTPHGQGDGPQGTRARLAALGMAGEDVAVLWTSGLVRHGPHAARADLPEEPKRRLRRFLLELKDRQPELYALIEREHGGGFTPAAASDYAGIASLLDAVPGGGR